MTKVLYKKSRSASRQALPGLEYEVYMLVNEARKTLPEISKILGISQQEADRLRNMAFRRLEKLTKN